MPTQDPAQTLYETAKALLNVPSTANPWWYDWLKDFQPLIGTVFAIVAAIVAYRGVTAQARLDRKLAERQRAAERRPLYHKLLAQISGLKKEADQIVEWMDKAVPNRPEPDDQVPWEGFRYRLWGDYDEVENAWNTLHLIPSDAVAPLRNLRSSLKLIMHFTEQYETRQTIDGAYFSVLRGAYPRAGEQSEKLVATMEVALKQVDKHA